MERTFAIIKPDAVKARHAGRILQRIEEAGFRIVALRLQHLTKPEALVYAPQKDGTLKLAAVEYVVLRKAWHANHTGRPSKFGHRFNVTPAGNRFGLPAFYSLHVWVWQHNPAGMFDDWNPEATCAYA